MTFLNSSTITIGQIDIVEPDFKLVQDEDKNWNIAKLVKKPEEPKKQDEPEQPRTVTILLHNIHVKDGKLHARMNDGKEAGITALSGEADIDLPPSGAEVNLNKLAFALSAADVPNSTWSAALSFKQGEKSSSLKVKQLSVATAQSRV